MVDQNISDNGKTTQDEVAKIVGGVNQDLPGPSFETGDAATQACHAIVDEVFQFEKLNPDRQMQNNFLHTLWHDMAEQYPLMAKTCRAMTNAQEVAKNVAELETGTGTEGAQTHSLDPMLRSSYAASYRDNILGKATRLLDQDESAAYFKDLRSAQDSLSPNVRSHLDLIDQMMSSRETDQHMYEKNGTLDQTAVRIKDQFNKDPMHPEHALMLYDMSVGGYMWRHPDQADQVRVDAFKKSLDTALGPIRDQLKDSVVPK